MSVFCSSSSTSRIIVSKLAPALSFLYPTDTLRSSRSQIRRRNYQTSPRQMVSSPAALEACFFNSLIAAGCCPKHSPKLQEPCTFTSGRLNVLMNRRQIHGTDICRLKHSTASLEEEIEDAEGEVKGEVKREENEMQVDARWLAPNRTKEELMALVDQYSEWSITDQLPLLELPNLYQPSDGPHLIVSDKAQDEWPPPLRAWPSNPGIKTTLNTLNESLRDFSKDPEEIYLLYRELPAPRVPYLESKTRHKLLRHLAVVEQKNEHAMLRYLSVVDDMKVTAIPLSSDEWTSAISFASRYVTRSTEVEVESALHMWREMEHVAGVKASDSTFNVLFDVACKAGKFTLAEMIYKEMRARGLQFTRYHHVSQIHYYGLKGDGDGARAAYKALVEAGEIVDTVVLNAMMSALVTAHEASAAENIYERMKKVHLETSGSALPSRDYKTQRMMTRVLMRMARLTKVNPARREEFQRRSTIAPDLQTYRILVNYFAVEAGELDKAAKLLDEMKLFKIPVHGALFLALFKGFAIHGGVRYTEWDQKKLESVWKAFMEALDNKALDLHMSKWMATWALKAFAKCSGKSRTVDVWEQIKGKWISGENDLDMVMKTLRPILEGEDVSKKSSDWIMGPT